MVSHGNFGQHLPVFQFKTMRIMKNLHQTGMLVKLQSKGLYELHLQKILTNDTNKYKPGGR